MTQREIFYKDGDCQSSSIFIFIMKSIWYTFKATSPPDLRLSKIFVGLLFKWKRFLYS